MNNSNKILSYLLVLASLFIIVLFTKDFIYEMQANIDIQNTKEKEINEKRSQVKKLQFIKKKLASQEDNEIKKYAATPSEDEIIDYIYSLIENGNKNAVKGKAEIKSISITEPKKNELGFLESNISIDLAVQKESRMKDILNLLVSDGAKYKFFIDAFSYEKPKITLDNTKNTSSLLNITIPLKVFYK